MRGASRAHNGKRYQNRPGFSKLVTGAISSLDWEAPQAPGGYATLAKRLAPSFRGFLTVGAARGAVTGVTGSIG